MMRAETNKAQAAAESQSPRLVDGNIEQVHRELVEHLRHFRLHEANILLTKLRKRGQLHLVPDSERPSGATATGETNTSLGEKR